MHHAGLRGAEIFLDEASVTATENALMAAVLARGETVVTNAACEPHVQDARALPGRAGRRTSRGSAPTSCAIEGVDRLSGGRFRIGPDHIEIASFIGLAAVTGSDLRIDGVRTPDLRMIRLTFERLGIRVEMEGDVLRVPPDQELRVEADEGDAIPKIDDGPWPAFPADLTSIATAVATQVHGTVMIFEKMFENRLFFVDKLVAMGARIVLCDPHRAVVSGPAQLFGERLESPDIRAGMAMLIASLARERHQRHRQHRADRPGLRAHRRASARAGRPGRAGSGVSRRPGRPRGARRRPAARRQPRRAAGRGRGAARRRERALRAAFAAFGYREVMTPVLELADVLDRAQDGGVGGRSGCSTSTGEVLVLRPDLTMPVSRLVASRLSGHPGPVRVSYVAGPSGRPAGRAAGGGAASGRRSSSSGSAARRPTPRWSACWSPACATPVSATCGWVSATSGSPPRCSTGSASLRPSAGACARRPARATWWPGAGPRGGSGLDGPAGALVAELPGLRGGPEVLERLGAAGAAAADACDRLASTVALLAGHGAGDAVLVDLSVMRDWSYYSGIVFEAYAPGAGAPVAVGGRYDGVGARFGRPRPAVGFAITLALLHRALGQNGRWADAPRNGVVLVGGMDAELEAAREARARGLVVVALPLGDERAEALAEADGWRWVARRSGPGFSVLDRASGERFQCPSLAEALA